MPAYLKRIAGAVLWGGLAGAVVLGVGARLVMRLLAMRAGLEPVFSVAGSLEVVAYGAIVGALAGPVVALATDRELLPAWLAGAILGLLAYAGTILTLPDHIAATVRPFEDDMAVLVSLFAICFLAFGYVMAAVFGRTAKTAKGGSAGP